MPNNSKSLKIKLAGEAGCGVSTSAGILIKTAAEMGFYTSLFKSFPSSVRGGYSQALITISTEKIISPVSAFDILFLLDEKYLDHEIHGLRRSGAALIIESNSKRTDLLKEKGITFYPVPFEKLSPDCGSSLVVRSCLAMGMISFIAGFSLDLTLSVLEKRFTEKPHSLESCIKALNLGYSWAEKNLNQIRSNITENLSSKSEKQVIVTGNQAIAMGAVSAGCRFFASYPITPATPIGEHLSKTLPSIGGVAYQAEDEIAAIGSVVGASFTGARSMTATSGPGLSLMQEFIGYASMAEIPVVIVDVQRGGPSTGMPTKPSQEDLMAAAFGGHGEGPRIVIAPTSTQDCINTTIEAFRLAEKYFCPVIILSDSTQGLTEETIDNPSLVNFNNMPERPRLPFRVTGLEHNKNFAPSENPEIRTEQVKNRFQKINDIESENPSLLEWDLEEGKTQDYDMAISAWGSTVPAVREAVIALRNQGYRVAAMYPKLLFPLCKYAVRKLASMSRIVFIPELNYTGQYCNLIRMYTGENPVSLTRYSGEPFTPDYLTEMILEKLTVQAKTVGNG